LGVRLPPAALMSSLTDEKLVARALKHDRTALGELFERYHKLFFNLAYRFCGDYYQADDLTSEIFLRVYRYLKSFDQKKKFRSWSYKVAANTCLTYQAKKARRKEQGLSSKLGFEGEGEAIALEEVLADTKVDLVRQAEVGEIETRVQGALNSLPKKSRLTLYLYYFEDLKYEEIAVSLGLPLNTVRTQIRRGKERLKKELADLIG
jgi:RNA polymerase sigma-70 factor (ECF subfamily)